MGRNSIPKLGEWSDGELFVFVVRDGVPNPDDGQLISYQRHRNDGETRMLGTCFADGFQECMASMWQAGYSKGVAAGRKEKADEMRRALNTDAS